MSKIILVVVSGKDFFDHSSFSTECVHLPTVPTNFGPSLNDYKEHFRGRFAGKQVPWYILSTIDPATGLSTLIKEERHPIKERKEYNLSAKEARSVTKVLKNKASLGSTWTVTDDMIAQLSTTPNDL